MDRVKIETHFNRFLLALLADEITESDQIIEDVMQKPPSMPLIEAPEDGHKSRYDEYMFRLANEVIEKYGFDQESAVELVLGIAGGLAERKCLPEMPKPGDAVEVETLEGWVAKAESIGFQTIVIEVAERIMKEAIQETEKDDEGNEE